MLIHHVLKGSFEHNIFVEVQDVTALWYGVFVALLLQLLQLV